MKSIALICLAFLLSACSVSAAIPAEPSPGPDLPDLDDQGLAPELTNQVWLNVDQPLRLAELRGSVVLLEMWTFG